MLSKYNQLVWDGTLETLYMVFVSLLIAVLLGIPLGILTAVTRKGHILSNGIINRVLNSIINLGRSIPFIILMVSIIPLTRLIVGTSIGTTAAIVPLAVAAIPFVGRIVDNALLEISPGVIEAAKSMGATPVQIIFKVLLPESLPSLILGITLTMINLIAYSAMAGAVGGGGLGDIAIRYGYQRFKIGVMIETIVILVLLVQIIQWIGNKLAAYFDHR
ncbi:methionine ABC transporter permease MetI [Iocasia frigidifontis]|uniref:Methionine ABC transporter permease MetI n=2 Tax=Halanaerobiaceae TaxID=972 RepID=A0A8A7KPP6_9FIRM|nr:methionine ABC transporter permease [Iocasia fonsfrigidae]AZO96766.1 ABC transporter permease [Halocella sp. SP3-1]MTI62091.1 ABC transporter permease [Bacillota bacterium]QTM00015.1 methionine ABC transporter permease MetI [Iocasia fonsfrigidae]